MNWDVIRFFLFGLVWFGFWKTGIWFGMSLVLVQFG